MFHILLAVHTHPGVRILLNIVLATLIMMIVITDMVEKADIHLGTTVLLCQAVEDMLETGCVYLS